MTIVEVPDEATIRTITMMVYAQGNAEKLNVVPLITAGEWKTIMERAKEIKTGYTVPTETK